jgi:hypothetical protein
VHAGLEQGASDVEVVLRRDGDRRHVDFADDLAKVGCGSCAELLRRLAGEVRVGVDDVRELDVVDGGPLLTWRLPK